ncbi:hypothetical protein [Pelosinus sp. IPA-1]|uniref:hypothetical protein n=1 Tax=Pelosinus sp. IPA-1 TaxID=3029569 RepID=UPI0024362712|nr:hypothetical protein [Pelosinus sp. IPA-1]GMA98952.1 hypothetical protein PIPA1_17520 [Pelosinus sp. IPA-1]
MRKLLHSWSIEARAFEIPFTPFAHNFWVLTDNNHIILDQLHGLAVDPETGETRAIGNSHDLLLAIQDATIVWSLQPNQPTVVCATASEAAIRQRWQAALNAIPAINALQLHYPNWWQHFHKKNSNSIFNTLGQILGIPLPVTVLPTWAPGIKLIISEDIINQFRYKE